MMFPHQQHIRSNTSYFVASVRRQRRSGVAYTPSPHPMTQTPYEWLYKPLECAFLPEFQRIKPITTDYYKSILLYYVYLQHFR